MSKRKANSYSDDRVDGARLTGGGIRCSRKRGLGLFLRLAGWKGKGWLDSWKGSVARDAPSSNAQEALFFFSELADRNTHNAAASHEGTGEGRDERESESESESGSRSERVGVGVGVRVRVEWEWEWEWE